METEVQVLPNTFNPKRKYSFHQVLAAQAAHRRTSADAEAVKTPRRKISAGPHLFPENQRKFTPPVPEEDIDSLVFAEVEDEDGNEVRTKLFLLSS